MQKDIKLVSPYFSKKLAANTLKTVLASPYQTAYRLYLMVNDIPEIQEFYELSHEDYLITATLKTVATPISGAKRQIWSVTHLAPICRKKPRWVVKATVTHKQSNKDVFKFHNETLSEETVCRDIADIVFEIENIIEK